MISAGSPLICSSRRRPRRTTARCRSPTSTPTVRPPTGRGGGRTRRPAGFGDLWEHPERFEGRRVDRRGSGPSPVPAGGDRRVSAAGRALAPVRPRRPDLPRLSRADGRRPDAARRDRPLRRHLSTADHLPGRRRGDGSPRSSVGPAAPEVLRRPATGPWRPVAMFGEVDWLLGLIVAAMVASAIVRLVLLRPRPAAAGVATGRTGRSARPRSSSTARTARTMPTGLPTASPPDRGPGDQHDAQDH